LPNYSAPRHWSLCRSCYELFLSSELISYPPLRLAVPPACDRGRPTRRRNLRHWPAKFPSNKTDNPALGVSSILDNTVDNMPHMFFGLRAVRRDPLTFYRPGNNALPLGLEPLHLVRLGCPVTDPDLDLLILNGADTRDRQGPADSRSGERGCGEAR